jgi:hypothetical protein
MQTHGVPIEVEWEEFLVGTSIFIPGVDQEELRRQLRWEMDQRKLKVVLRFTVENNILGVRVWRVP